jgi:hypothetical protein
MHWVINMMYFLDVEYPDLNQYKLLFHMIHLFLIG